MQTLALTNDRGATSIVKTYVGRRIPLLTAGRDFYLLSGGIIMKSAYELAMERLNKTSPTVKLSDEQKKELAELESLCVAKIADRELFLQGQIAKAIDKEDAEAVEQLEKQLASERKSIRAEFEEKKDKIRSQGKT